MYKPELMTNYTPWFQPVPALPLTFTDIKQGETVCLEISKDLVPYLLGLLELARWKDRFDGTPEEQAHSVGVFQDLVSAMITGNTDCKPCDSPVKIVKGKDTNTWDMRIENEMAIINIYECGCGCGSHNSTGGKELNSVSGGGGSGGSWDNTNAISDVVVTPPPTATTSTLCDIVTGGMLDYVLQQVIEFLETARTIAGSSAVPVNAIIDASEIVPVIGTLTDAGWDAIAQILVIGTDAILDMLRDVDFQDKFKIAYIQGNPNDPGTNITRQTLLNAANKLPYTWLQGTVVILPRLVMSALVNVLRMDKIRRRLALYEGSANASLCSYYYSEASVAEPTAPSTGTVARPQLVAHDTLNKLMLWNFTELQRSYSGCSEPTAPCRLDQSFPTANWAEGLTLGSLASVRAIYMKGTSLSSPATPSSDTGLSAFGSAGNPIVTPLYRGTGDFELLYMEEPTNAFLLGINVFWDENAPVAFTRTITDALENIPTGSQNIGVTVRGGNVGGDAAMSVILNQFYVLFSYG